MTLARFREGLVLLALLSCAAAAGGDTGVWDNGAGDNDWFDPRNWDPNGAPDTSDRLIVLLGAPETSLPVEVSGGGSIALDGAGASASFGNLRVAVDGRGHLDILNGAHVVSVENEIGCNSLASGGVSVAGAGSRWVMIAAAKPGAGSVGIGVNGTGRLNILAGGEVSGVNAYVGVSGGSDGQVTVDGAGSRWISDGDLGIGLSGFGLIEVSGAGEVLAKRAIVGDGLTGTGRAIVTGAGSRLRSGAALYVGDEGRGVLEVLSGGEVICDTAFVGDWKDSNGHVTVAGTGSRWESGFDVVIGDEGLGRLDILSGGTVTDRDGRIGGAGSVVTVEGAGSTWANSHSLSVGRGWSEEYGRGYLYIQDGGLVTSSTGQVGWDASQVTVAGAGAGWRIGTELRVGYQGPGTLEVADGGEVEVAGTLHLEGAGTLSLSGGTVRTGSFSHSADGRLDLSGGEMIVDGGTFDSNSSLTLDGAGDATITLSHGVTGNISGELTVGDAHGQATRLHVLGGSQLTGEVVFIGRQSGAQGVIRVEGAGSSWQGGRLYVGEQGGGALEIRSGGTVRSEGGMLGEHPDANGSVSVIGSDSRWVTNAGGPPAGTLTVGVSGTGRLDIRDGGEVSGYACDIASARGSQGHVTVDGAGSCWINQFLLNVGNCGVGTLEITRGGEVRSQDAVIGEEEGSKGEVLLDGHGSTWTLGGGFAVGASGRGLLEIRNGAEVQGGTGYIGQGGGSNGRVTVDGPATLCLCSGLHVGARGVGTLEIRDGAVVYTQSGYIGMERGSEGWVTVDGHGSKWDISGLLEVARSGVGLLEIRNGAEVWSGHANIGPSRDSDGRVAVEGEGSTWTIGGDLSVRESGRLIITDGGRVDVHGTFEIREREDGAATVELTEGSLEAHRLEASDRSVFRWTGGTLSLTGPLELHPEGPFGPALALSDGMALSAFLVEVREGMTLTLAGGDIQAEGLSNSGTIHYDRPGGMRLYDTLHNDETGRLHVAYGQSLYLDADIENAGRIELHGGGAALLGEEPWCLSNTGLILGDGEIAGNVENHEGAEIRVESDKRLLLSGDNGHNEGTISLLGGAVELAREIVNDESGDVFCRGTWMAREGLTNRGDLAFSGGHSDVFGDVGNEDTGRVIISGASDVTFWDDVENDGALFRVSADSSATFFGEYSGLGISGEGETYFEADVTPGFSAAVIGFEGDVALGPQARLNIELAGDDNSDPLDPAYDALEIDGDVALAGTLSLSWLVLPGDPNSKFGGVYDILSYGGSRSGAFDAIDCRMAAYLDTSLFADGVEYDDANGAVKVHLYDLLDGDADLDGKVAREDFAALQSGFAADQADWLDGDFNFDGRVDFLDYLIWKANVGDAVPGAGKVPEPAALSLLALPAAVLLARRRTRQPRRSRPAGPQ